MDECVCVRVRVRENERKRERRQTKAESRLLKETERGKVRDSVKLSLNV